MQFTPLLYFFRISTNHDVEWQRTINVLTPWRHAQLWFQTHPAMDAAAEGAGLQLCTSHIKRRGNFYRRFGNGSRGLGTQWLKTQLWESCESVVQAVDGPVPEKVNGEYAARCERWWCQPARRAYVGGYFRSRSRSLRSALPLLLSQFTRENYFRGLKPHEIRYTQWYPYCCAKRNDRQYQRQKFRGHPIKAGEAFRNWMLQNYHFLLLIVKSSKRTWWTNFRPTEAWSRRIPVHSKLLPPPELTQSLQDTPVWGKEYRLVWSQKALTMKTTNIRCHVSPATSPLSSTMENEGVSPVIWTKHITYSRRKPPHNSFPTLLGQSESYFNLSIKGTFHENSKRISALKIICPANNQRKEALDFYIYHQEHFVGLDIEQVA